jgi:uncharacterized protein
MQMDQIIQNTENFVKGLLVQESTGHDWWHVVRLRNSARKIYDVEGGDWFIIDMTLMLHDVGDRKVIGKDDDDYSIAEDFLVSQRVPRNVIDQILFIIQNMSFSKSLNTKKADAPIEFYIVQDADRLDAIGAIGIARAFAYGGSKGRLLYDPTKQAQDITTTENYKKLESSTFHHFEEKLLLIKDLLNTKTAQKIADERDKYMRGYMAQFLDEWDGRK